MISISHKFPSNILPYSGKVSLFLCQRPNGLLDQFDGSVRPWRNLAFERSRLPETITFSSDQLKHAEGGRGGNQLDESSQPMNGQVNDIARFVSRL